MTWTAPYLESCCRSALHRLSLAGSVGRPSGLKDGPCLERMTAMGLCGRDADGRYRPTPAGTALHAALVAGQPDILARQDDTADPPRGS